MSPAAPLLAAMLAVSLLAADAHLAPPARTHTVTMSEMRFRPASLTVRRGDTIEWINDDVVPHTATSTRGAFDSGAIAAGSTWRWTAGARGTVSYVCALHPAMSAQLQVE